MVKRQNKRRSGSTTRRATTARAGVSWVRLLAAVAVLVAGVGVVVWVAWRAGRERAAETPPSAVELLRSVASRHGLSPDRVVGELSGAGDERLWTLTIHAPRGFQLQSFVLDLEALAHNLGGRLDPQTVTEGGGYGLARLDGRVGEERWRVLVLGEEPPHPPPERAPARRRTTPARLAIVLDDAGYSVEAVDELARLPQAVAVAVLPNAPHSAEVAAALRGAGRELLLHMPMEPMPSTGPGPGPGAIMVGEPAAEVERRLDEALAVVRGARGVNNHMGSRASADAETMGFFMAALRGRGLYFLDSRTTTETVAEQLARADGVGALRRDVFLDVVDEPGAVRRALGEAVARARANGSAVAIGHVHPVTIRVLAEELPGALGDVLLVEPSRLVAGDHSRR